MNGVARSDPVFVTARKQLEALARQSPELAAAAAVQQALFPVQWAARAQQPTPTVDVAAAQQALAAGRPILAGQDLDFDPIAAGQCFRHLASAAETALRPGAKRGSHFDGRRRAVSAIHRQAKRGRLDLSAVWQALATGNAATLEVLASGAGLEAQWLRLIGENSLKPAFRAFQAEISQTVDLAGWQRGLCPICGSPPTLAEVQGKEGARQLRCGLCAAGWPYPRVRCAFCANTDHLTLGTLSLEGEAEKYRVQTCGVCHGYLKVVVTFDPIPEDLLAIEDLMTLHLDLIAAERGYSRDKVAA